MARILIIEDDTIVASIYRNKFQAEGYAVTVAPDGEAGLQAASAEPPDLVVVDLMLPRMNGVEVIRRLRSVPETKSTPVIVFSNSYVTTLIQAAWNAGANNCLTKATCTPKQLIEVVERTLARSAAGGPGAGASYAPLAGALPAGDLPPSPAAAAGAAGAHPGLRVPAAAAYRASHGGSDAAFQDDLRQSFLASGPAAMVVIRNLFALFSKAESEPERVQRLQELYRKIHSLTSNAAITGLKRIAQMSAAMEALVKELCEKPQHVNASTSRTVAHAVDGLAAALDHASQVERGGEAPNILVVDDEIISRRAIIYALNKSGLKCVSVEDPLVALGMLQENRFDLIFLDVDMPGMTGFELCTKLRTTPEHAKTPVIFVTALSDFEHRAQSMISGGNDLIGKPFLFVELAVKALTFLLKGALAATRS